MLCNKQTKLNLIILVVGVIVGLVCSSSVLGATLNVPGDYPTIQSAIEAAIDGDMVQVADGTYTGVGNRDLDFGGKAIMLQSESGADVTIIDCQGTQLDPHRGFYFHSGETVASVVDGFTIKNGLAIGSYQADYSGGAIYCNDNSSPTITNCTISGNSAESAEAGKGWGGGISCYSYSSPAISNCTISGNSASYGGGIFCNDNSSPTITNCMISGNSTNDHGGGIYCGLYSSPTITNCTISGNYSTIWYGGGIYCSNSNPTITNCTISGNSAYQNGGGIFCGNSNPVITNCTISGNEADYGGGIYCSHSSSPTITNCTIIGNAADVYGGGAGGGIFCWYDSSPTITNCILWGNGAPNGHEIALISTSNPSMLTVRYSDVQGGAGEAYIHAGCTLDMDVSNIDQDPEFVADGSWDGGTWVEGDYHLTSGSPCIDTGDNTAVPPIVTTDLDGNPRIVNGIVDMGAFEAQLVNQPPVAVCQDVTVMGDSYCEGVVAPEDVNNGSSDPDGDPIILSLSPQGPYPMGTTAVTLTVTDDQGASSSCMAAVKVLTASEGILRLIAKVMILNLHNGIENSLDAKLDAAVKALDDVNANNDVAAINAINAFINAVEAQSGDKIATEDADDLIDTANKVIVGLQNGCY